MPRRARADLPPRAGAHVSRPGQRADLLDEETVDRREDAEVAADGLELGVADVERRRGQPPVHAHTRSPLKLPREPQVDVCADGHRSRREPRRRASVRARLDRVDHEGGRAEDPDALDRRAEQALGLRGSGRHSDDGRSRTSRWMRGSVSPACSRATSGGKSEPVESENRGMAIGRLRVAGSDRT